MDETPIYIFSPQKRRGRPRANEPRASLSTWLPVSHYDEIVKQANAREMSVSQFVRVVLTRAVTVKR
jgi:hypothetical protein